MDKEVEENLQKLIEAENKNSSLKNAFLRGIFYGFGFFLGSALLVTVAISILSYFDTAPIIGTYIKDIIKIIQ